MRTLAAVPRFVRAVLLLVLALTATVSAQTAQEVFQRGLVQENASGNLEAAIALYLQASEAAGTNRSLAARARIRAAGCYEKLGRPIEAEDEYTAVMRAYPDQRAEVAIAQERLTVLRSRIPVRALIAHDGKANDGMARVASVLDRYCAHCHNASNQAVALDLSSVSARHIASNTAQWENVVRRLLARRDPPVGQPRPDENTYREVIATLQAALDAAYAGARTLEREERVNGVELATRLASFIWDAAPDAPLLDVARQGQLDDPAILRRQVTRMLRDPKSASLVSRFFAGWLAFGKVRTAKIDASVNPQFDAALAQAMETETRLFIESQLRGDRDALELWTANYTYLNERLARHYGLTGITGKEFRRTTWPDTRRAGVLGQASILTGNSFPTRTSPTMRGRYVLVRFLGVDAPSPPANVPPLPEGPASAGTMRQRLSAHKVNPSCASCHAIFDPIGHALENFDAAGAWRTTDGSSAIDVSGSFVDGTRFSGPAGLRNGLLKYRDAYYATVTQQLLAFALNRTGKGGRLYDYEMPAVRTIVREAASSDHRWSAILAGIAASAPFQTKTIVP